MWQQVEEARELRVNRARLRSAWKATAKAIEVLEQAAPGSQSASRVEPVDWEAPLTDNDNEEMRSAWDKRYELKLAAWVNPGDPLVNRLHREFRNWMMSVIKVSKMKSVLHD